MACPMSPDTTGPEWIPARRRTGSPLFGMRTVCDTCACVCMPHMQAQTVSKQGLDPSHMQGGPMTMKYANNTSIRQQF